MRCFILISVYGMVWYGIEFQAALLGLRYLYLHIMTNYDYFFYSLNTNESYSYVRVLWLNSIGTFIIFSIETIKLN